MQSQQIFLGIVLKDGNLARKLENSSKKEEEYRRFSFKSRITE